MRQRWIWGFVLLLVWGPAWSAGAYTIRAGDLLRIEVLQDPSLNRSVLVLPDGSIDFPYLDAIAAAGRRPQDLGKQLAAALARQFAVPPNVNVAVERLAAPRQQRTETMTVYAMGEVRRAGALSLPRNATVLQAVAAAGGLTEFAAAKRVELLRRDAAGGTRSLQLDLRTPTATAAAAMALEPGDIVVVPALRLFEFD